MVESAKINMTLDKLRKEMARSFIVRLNKKCSVVSAAEWLTFDLDVSLIRLIFVGLAL